MPAHHVESEDAEAEGAIFELLVNPTEVLMTDGKVVGVRLQKMRLGDPDASGRRSPEPIPDSEYVRDCDVVISTIGMSPDAALYAKVAGTARSDRIKVDPETLQSEIPYLFAAGDVTTGATDITTAIGAGRRAAHMLDRWLSDLPLDGFTALDDRLATIDHETVLARQTAFGHRHPVTGDVRLVPHPSDFDRDRSSPHRGSGTRRRGQLPGLWRLLGVSGVCQGMPGGLHRLRSS